MMRAESSLPSSRNKKSRRYTGKKKGKKYRRVNEMECVCVPSIKWTRTNLFAHSRVSPVPVGSCFCSCSPYSLFFFLFSNPFVVVDEERRQKVICASRFKKSSSCVGKYYTHRDIGDNT